MLYILLSCLDVDLPQQRNFRFECRDISNGTLLKIKKDDLDDADENILKGKRIIKYILNNNDIDTKDFREKLHHVILFRIKVPDWTDVNRYFEVMNTRGEQLEQHDIVKARLMSCLQDTMDEVCFATIWEACSDMDGYVQMHFTKNVREALFGNSWTDFPKDEAIRDCAKLVNNVLHGCTIEKIINDDAINDTQIRSKINKDRSSFEAITRFPHFLLHVLKVYVKKEKLSPKISLDDKELVATFDRVLGCCKNKSSFVRKFIICLLQCRYLFDKYVIKRVYTDNANSEYGEWSLNELKKQNNRYDRDYTDTSLEECHKRILMLEACLRVSYTSPDTMHWITRILLWLYKNIEHYNAVDFEGVVESYIKRRVHKYLEGNDFCMGVKTPRIVFNYLDYCLWIMKREKREDVDFVFRFSNSVEHWEPQHPAHHGKWARQLLDSFGNLCLVSRSINSRFNNLPPVAKLEYKDDINNGSLKLREMAELTRKNMLWEKNICEKHHEKMIKILTDKCKQ